MSRHGVLVVDKPGGMTSAAVVARVKRALGAKRVGHTGTLDPMATGVLPICVGEATKLAGYMLADAKAYEGELELGAETDTLDREGRVVRENREAAAAVSADDVASAMRALLGDSEQVPPMYSALKKDGVRLHQLARKGIDVDRDPRPVRVTRFDVLSSDMPRVRFRVDCSKGTYVRSLVADVGAALGCGAHLTALRRVRSGAFDIDAAIPLDRVSPDCPLVDPAEIATHLPSWRVPERALSQVSNGLQIQWCRIADEPAPDGVVRLLTPDGALLALATVRDETLRYERVFRYGLS